MPTIHLADAGLTLQGREGESITATLLRAGFMMRLACRGGGCGLCRVRVDSGRTVYSAAIADSALPVEERDKGIVLACLAVPADDVTITVPPEAHLRCIAPQITPYAIATTQ